MSLMFFNGPVQNGNFTLASHPGKAVGIRIAEALNTLLGMPSAPHLWNTTTLSGDQRHRELADRELVTRDELEARLISAKYHPDSDPTGGTLSDTAPEVASLAVELTEQHLAAGTLAIAPVQVRVCARCGHMTGTGPHSCRACGHTVTQADTARHLIADRNPARPVLTRDDFYGRAPAHLLDIASNAPQRLILSRTRSHGIDLAPLGLEGLVLDPRAAVHITVLAAARRHQVDTAVMTTTLGAAANVAAHGAPFLRQDGRRLLYAVHGRVPYDENELLDTLYEIHRISPDTRDLFIDWFLPLASLRGKSGIPAAQLTSLLKFLRRALLARPACPDEERLHDLRQAIRAGDLRWVMDIRTLPHVIVEAQKSLKAS